MSKNLNPTLFTPVKPRFEQLKQSLSLNDFQWDGTRELINQIEIFNHIRDIQDPEHPHSLEVLGVVSESWIAVNDVLGHVSVEYSPTIPGCSMATLIGLAIKVKLLRSLPRRFKIEVKVKSGTHDTELEINKQLADKERVAAALENPQLLKLVIQCLKSDFDSENG